MAGPRLPASVAEHTGDTTLDRVQAHLRTLMDFVRLVPFLPGRAVMVHFTTGGSKQIVNHKLGTEASCFVIRWNSESGMAGPTFAEWNDQTGLDTKNQMALVASAVCIVVLWFYPRLPLSILSGKNQS